MIERIRQEPVVFAGVLQGLLIAVNVLAGAFGWWEWTQEQLDAVLVVWGALTAIGTFLIRKAVVPAVNVEEESWSFTPPEDE